MNPDFNYALTFPAVRRFDVLTALQRRSASFSMRATIGAGNVSGGCSLALDVDEELEQVLGTQGYESMMVSERTAQIGMVYFWGEIKHHGPSSQSEPERFDLTFWPCTTGLQRIFLQCGVVRAFLVELLTSFGGLQGWLDFGDGSEACFWSAERGEEGWFDLDRKCFVPARASAVRPAGS